MKRLKQWVSKLSVKKKLIFYGYLIITPVLVAVCIVLVIYNYNNQINKVLEKDISGINTLSESINVLQTEIKDFSTYICINGDINALLKTTECSSKNQNAKLWLEEAPMQIIQDMMAIKGNIRTVAIYPENGIRSYLRCMDGSSYIANKKTVQSTKTYKDVFAKCENGMMWKSVSKGYGDTFSTNRSDKLVLYRKIVDLAHKKNLGYLVIGTNKEPFTRLCESIVDGDETGIVVIDKNGGEIAGAGKINKDVHKYLLSKKFVNQKYNTREEHFSYRNYEIICSQMGLNSSIICKVVPKYSMQMQAYDIAYMPILLLVGMLAGLLPLLVIISNIFTKPLRQVSEAIRKFAKGDFNQQVEVSTSDEIGEVAICFNKMVGDIEKLINENYVITLKEKESELAALQSQINPHFLYNTLDSLYWQATEAGDDDIAESVYALSQLFKLVLSKGQGVITVGQEIELVARYLQIQKMRFSKRLNYNISVDENINKAKIPKLIIQPFVENAIVHGFENVSKPCELNLSGKREGEFLHFEIEDTGIGMSKDQVQEIWKQETDKYAKQRIGRYAIKNIKERLELKYGDNFKLEINSKIGVGTTVILILPYEGEEV